MFYCRLVRVFFFAVLLIVTTTQVQAVKTNRWIVTAEVGAGTLLSGTGSYAVIPRLRLGLGTGFDIGSFTIGEEHYGSFLWNSNLFAEYLFFEKDLIDIRGRLKVGYDLLAVGKHTSSCYEIAPEILAGYRDIYVIFSGITVFGRDAAFIPQIGVGYRFRF